MNYNEMKNAELDKNLCHNFDMLSQANTHETEMACEMSSQCLDNIKDIYAIKAMMRDCGEAAAMRVTGHQMAVTPQAHMHANAEHQNNNANGNGKSFMSMYHNKG